MDERTRAFLSAIELHDGEQLERAIAAGIDVTRPIEGRTAFTWLTEMYTRSPRFKDLARALLLRGARLDDARLEPVLLDDAAALRSAVARDPGLLEHRTRLRCAFTPLEGATLLHLAAELGHLSSAEELLRLGARVDATAEIDREGLGGHTPLFHSVNSNANRSRPVMELLLDHGARTDARIPGLTWGRGFEWESTFLDLTPLSYCQLGLLPQMHRDARDIHSNLERLLHAAGRTPPAFANVPNRYLSK